MATEETRNAWARIEHSALFRIDGEDIDLCDAIIALCAAIEADDDDDGPWYYLGECGDCTAADFLIGANWALTEWHGGQWSPEYAALSAIWGVYSPGMADGPEPDTGEAYAYEVVGAYFEARETERDRT